MHNSVSISLLALCSGMMHNASGTGSDDPFADEVISYHQGIGATVGYTDSSVTLGSPERFTGEDVFPSVVSAFSAPYGTDEILSIGAGGQLTVRFNSPVTNDPNNLYGIDLLIFGNTSFYDADFPNGLVGGVLGNDGGVIEVSADGINWHTIPNLQPDSLMPSMGYVDSGAFDEFPGSVLTDFTRPVDPLLMLDHFMGLTNAQVVQRYRGSGGGVGVDLASVGLRAITHVRISNPAGAKDAIEIDAFSDVSPRVSGDVDLNGLVNVNDLLLVINAWGAVIPGSPPADFNNDGVVNVNDLLTVINNWGPPA